MPNIKLGGLREGAAGKIMPVVCHDESRAIAVTATPTVVELSDAVGNPYEAFEIRHRDDTSARVYMRKGADDQVTVTTTDRAYDDILQFTERRIVAARTRHADGGAQATHMALVCESGATATVILTGLS